MITSPMLSFDSSAFPVGEDEDAQTNPGIYGKAFATWLGERLKAQGVATTKPYAEDWGWCVEVPSEHRTGLACSSEDGEKTAWRVYAFANPGLLARFRSKDSATKAVEELYGKVKDILASEASVTNLRSE